MKIGVFLLENYRNVNLMKSIVESIVNEKVTAISTSIDYNVTDDIYNILSELAFEYEKNGKSKLFDEKSVKKALDNFVNKFFQE